MEKFNYQGVAYNCDRNNLANYIKANDDKLCIMQKGVETPYAVIDTDNNKLIINSQIEKGTFGQAAEATRIKLCAILNCAIDTFESQNWDIESAPLGEISCKQSCLDSRGGKVKINLADIFKPKNQD